ncbi:M15 family metallopeptidase [Cellulomonas sp. Marseille-Q8402]
MASHRVQPAATGAPTRRQLRESGRSATALPAAPAPAVEADGAAHDRRSNPLARWGTRAGVLVTLAAVTVAVPLSQQSAQSEEVADVQADATLPSTVEALTSSTSAVLPPASLVSGDATAVRAQVDVSRSQEREILPGCDGEAGTASANGQLPQGDLCVLWDGGTELRADAAEALAELNAMWVTRFGSDLCLSSGYRTLAEQRAVKAQKGGLAAPAGRSNHGWGLAVDLCSSQTTGAQWEWLNENAPVFGWENPSWARPGGSGPYERWHWEYTKGVMADGEYYG